MGSFPVKNIRPVARLSLRGWLLVLVAITAGSIGMIADATDAFNALERKTIDARFRRRGGGPPPAEIVIVAVDPKSLTAINERPPISRRHYANLLEHLGRSGARLIAVDVKFVGTSDDASDDELLAALARNGPVLLGTNDTRHGPVPVPAGRRSAPGVVLGSVGIELDSDNVLRQMIYAPVTLKSFAVRAAEMVTGTPVAERNFDRNHAWIDFRGPPGTFRRVPLIDVLEGRVPASTFVEKVVLVGVTDPVSDVYVTAVSGTPMPGVEVHANALSTILRGFPVNTASTAVNALLVAALAAFPALLTSRLSALYALAGVMAVGLVFIAVAQVAFESSGAIVSVVAPLTALGISAAASVAADSFVEKRQRRRLEASLGALLPPPAPSAFFISYRREDSGWPARALKKELAKRFGEASVFLDTTAIYAGQEWPRRIEAAIRGCSVMLVLIGKRWLEPTDGARRLDDPRDWVRREVEGGLGRKDVLVIPVLLDGAEAPAENELPVPLKELTHREAVTLSGEHLEEEVDDLLNSIQKAQAQAISGQRDITDAENAP